MRKNKKDKLERQRKRKELNALKKPISQYENKLWNLKSSIKIWGIISIILMIIVAVGFYLLHIDSDVKEWKTETIIYKDSWTGSSKRYRAGTSYWYNIVDQNGNQYEIQWYSSFDKQSFENEVHGGDNLTITWNYWLGKKLINAIQSSDRIYRSYDDAVSKCKMNKKFFFIILSLLTFVDMLSICTFYKRIKTKKNTLLLLSQAKSDLDTYLEKR